MTTKLLLEVHGKFCWAQNKLSFFCSFSEVNRATPVKFVYTPMHGVGQDYIFDCLSSFQLNPFISVDLQVRIALNFKIQIQNYKEISQEFLNKI